MTRLQSIAMTLLMGLSLLATVRCTSDDTYSIEASAAGLGNRNLRLVYMGDDAVHTAVATSIDGKFTFSGKLEEPVQMDVYTGDGVLLARLIVSPGEHIRLKLDIKDYGASEVEGSDATGRLIDFLHDSPDGARSLNAYISRYVGQHRDDPVSAVLVTGYYDLDAGTAAEADSLLGLVDARARRVAPVDSYATLLAMRPDGLRQHLPATLRLRTSGADSAVNISTRAKGRTLLAIQDIGTRPELSRAARDAGTLPPGTRLIEVSLAQDSLQWAITLRNDTLPGSWTSAYTPAGVMDLALKPLGIHAVPYYIVADSTGLILMRTAVPGEAFAALAR